ncbi:MAG: hypothetical protein J5510_08270 [Prevotella sp.]|nr:hypothetical protein [Prevotella sp.]
MFNRMSGMTGMSGMSGMAGMIGISCRFGRFVFADVLNIFDLCRDSAY